MYDKMGFKKVKINFSGRGTFIDQIGNGLLMIDDSINYLFLHIFQLLKAVELIPILEKKVEEKNRTMGTRRECLKQRLETAGQSPSAAMSMPPQMLHQGKMNSASISPFPPLATGPHPSAILGLGPGPSGIMHHPQQTQAAGGGGGHFN